MKTTHGIYYISGNHDKGYYGAAHRGFSEDDLFNELKKNGINILQDESILVDNSFYVIGRRDYSVQHEQGGHRKSIEELTKDLDKSKYMIVLDHQPVEYNKEADAKVDLVLSGHTHGGQLFPFNQVGKWIKANDMIYGYEKRKNTDFIVTSGISDWAIKFKTGTKSEFVIIDIKKGNINGIYKLIFPFNEFVNINTPKGNKTLPHEPLQTLAEQSVQANDNEKVQIGYKNFCEPQFIEKKTRSCIGKYNSSPNWLLHLEVSGIKPDDLTTSSYAKGMRLVTRLASPILSRVDVADTHCDSRTIGSSPKVNKPKKCLTEKMRFGALIKNDA